MMEDTRALKSYSGESSMREKKKSAHPYIPNSAPGTKQEMLAYLGLDDVSQLFAGIPESLKIGEDLALPAPCESELALIRHVTGLLSKNRSCGEYLNFQGGGCWHHFIPAVCDEIASRGEFLTAYTGSRHGNLGSFQAQFEYQSMLAELVGFDVVSYATYDWGSAAASSLSMARRVTGRTEILVAGTTGPLRLSQIQTRLSIGGGIKVVDYQPATAGMDLDSLVSGLSPDTAAVYIEIPSYLGVLEPRIEEISREVHSSGALLVVGTDPISLGILAPPREYGADIACGPIQPLGIHMYFGGGMAGFMAMPDVERFTVECPWPLLGILPTEREGEYTYGWVNFDSTSYCRREKSRDFTGTGQTLWAIVAAVYMALLGPAGLREIGDGIVQRCRYAMAALSSIGGLTVPVFDSAHFKEFVIRFDANRRRVAEVNALLRSRRIFGGINLERYFPELGNSALYCVTEIHTKEDIDRLASALREIMA